MMMDHIGFGAWIAHVHRSDTGPEFVAAAPREPFAQVAVETLFIEPGSHWGTGYKHNFNDNLRALSRRTILDKELAANYYTARPHRAFGYWPLAPNTKFPFPKTSSEVNRKLCAL